MGEIYLIRHAEAEGNRYRRIHGHTDTNVTKNGLRQIAALQKRFEGVEIHAVYASDLTRTCRTATALAGPRGLEIRRDPRFREIYLGAWEDIPFGELEQTDAEQLRNFNSAPKRWRADGAERYEEYTARFLAGLRELAGRHPTENIAVFTHGGVLFQSLRILFPDSDPAYGDLLPPFGIGCPLLLQLEDAGTTPQRDDVSALPHARRPLQEEHSVLCAGLAADPQGGLERFLEALRELPSAAVPA